MLMYVLCMLRIQFGYFGPLFYKLPNGGKQTLNNNLLFANLFVINLACSLTFHTSPVCQYLLVKSGFLLPNQRSVIPWIIEKFCLQNFVQYFFSYDFTENLTFCTHVYFANIIHVGVHIAFKFFHAQISIIIFRNNARTPSLRILQEIEKKSDRKASDFRYFGLLKYALICAQRLIANNVLSTC